MRYTAHSTRETDPATVPPLQQYAVAATRQEILEKIAASTLSGWTKPIELKLKASNGATRDVVFDIETTGHDKISNLIIGVTTKMETINVSLPKDGGEATAQLRS